MEIPDELLLKLQRTGYDVYIRNCGEVWDSTHKALIAQYPNNGHGESLSKCLWELIRAGMIISYESRGIRKPGQSLGNNTAFVDGLRQLKKDGILPNLNFDAVGGDEIENKEKQ